MKSNIINNIGYTGSVNVRLSTSNEVFAQLKNSGKKPLWNALAMAMAGYDISNNRPYSLMIGQKNANDGSNYEDCLIRRIPFLGTVWGDPVDVDNESTSVRFTAIVSKSDKQISRPKSGNILVLRMYSIAGTDDDEFLAEIEDVNNVLKNSYSNIITGVDAIFEWILKFENKTSTESD